AGLGARPFRAHLVRLGRRGLLRLETAAHRQPGHRAGPGRRRTPRRSRTATGGVLRVPGRRCVVDGELARRLDGGLLVGLVIAGCGPAPAVPVPIAVHSSSWCGGAPSCRAGATVIVVRSSSGLSEAAAESSLSG